MTFHPDALSDLGGKVFIVTGGTSGIGYYITVAHLAEHGAHVYMCARSTAKATKTISDIKKTKPSAQVDVWEIDLMDLGSVVAAAERFPTLETALHGLVNKAGIMATPFEMTKDGHEAQWQTNYLFYWVLTERLLPLMLQTAEKLPAGTVRIVNITSSDHLSAPKVGINFDDTTLKNDTIWARYGQSKLANILYTKALQEKYGPGLLGSTKREGDIWVSSVHPGIVETNISTAVSQSGSGMLKLFSVFRMLGMIYPPDKGSYTSLFCGSEIHDCQCHSCLATVPLPPAQEFPSGRQTR